MFIRIALITVIAFATLGAQTGAAPESSDTIIRSSAREVLLDVVVRKKNLQLDRKLTRADFAITEDGVPQTIKTFRLVSERAASTAISAPKTASPASQATPSPAPGNTKLEEPSFVSLVFEQISPHSREYAREAVHHFLSQELQSQTYVAVFTLNYRIDLVQSFTNQRDPLIKAVDAAAMSDYSHLSRDNASIMNQAGYALSSDESGVSLTTTTDLAQTPDLSLADASTPNFTDGAMAAAKIISDQRDVAMYQGGMRTMVALNRLVDYESSLPGRKTVIYLSEGLNLPPEQREMMQPLIAKANRGNVSFYAVDVRGLSATNSTSLPRQLLGQAAATSRTQNRQLTGQSRMTQANQEDTIQQMSVGDTELNMVELSEKTGGFAIVETNEIGKAMGRVMEDVRTHYEITYVPTSTNFDGHFRQIAVKVSNPKLTIQSRDGYFALPDLDGKPLQPFEVEALRGLNAKPLPKAFQFRMAALRFQPMAGGFQHEIVFSLPISQITPSNLETAKVRLHATFLALIKDSGGQVVEKVSREIDREVPKDKFDQFQRGEMTFSTPVVLAQGRYTVEAAVMDSTGGRASAKRVALVVPPPGPFAVSDIALIKDLLPLDEPRDPGNPLEFTGGKVSLNIDGSGAAPASLFFVVYPGRATEKPAVLVQFFQDGKRIAIDRPKISDPDEARSIPVIASAHLPAGDYEARVTVQEGNRITHAATAFSVAP